MNTRVIWLIDDRGRRLVPDEDMIEPTISSIVLTEGLHGTAWQRHASDGRWRPSYGGGSASWADLLCRRRLVLVYEAPEDRPAPREQRPAVQTWATGSGN